MFNVVLNEWVCKNMPMVKQLGCPPYLLASAIESSTALLRACNKCEMLKPLPGSSSISFIALLLDCAGRLDKRSSLGFRIHQETFISHEGPLLHLGRCSFRYSPVTGERNAIEHYFARCSWTRMERAPIDRIHTRRSSIQSPRAEQPPNLTSTRLEVHGDERQECVVKSSFSRLSSKLFWRYDGTTERIEGNRHLVQCLARWRQWRYEVTYGRRKEVLE